jgi:hypothetical protein
MSILDFLPRFTLKSAADVAQKQDADKLADRQLSDRSTRGIAGVIYQKQSEVDYFKARVQGFLSDVEKHFERSGVGKYLSDDYKVYTKFDGVQDASRRLGLKWSGNVSADVEYPLVFNIAFAYSEAASGVRVDYIGTVSVPNWSKKGIRKEINNEYTPALDDVYVAKSTYSDKFQSTRYFDTHEDFNEGISVPDWFVAMLKEHVRPIRG